MSQEASGSPRFSYATAENVQFLEGLYAQYQKDPSSVDASWQRFFEGYELAARGDALGGAATTLPSTTPPSAPAGDHESSKVEAFINAYRRLGHLMADISPIPTFGAPEAQRPDLSPEGHGLKDVQPNRKFRPTNLPQKEMPFSDILGLLTDTYTGKIGADFREVNDIGISTWLQDQMERCRNKPAFNVDVKRRILRKLTQAEGFEQFLGRRYIGAKRFSCEGSDTLIPMLDALATDAAALGVEEIALGMAHRGRLNVLANFMGKPYEVILTEFEGTEFNPHDIDGDVKYHKGFASEVPTADDKRIRLYLNPNPSHLECVNPVVEGFVRARQHLIGDEDGERIVPVLLHGDAAMMGQGIVAETLNMSQLAGYYTGGTIHIIVNNQIGFTTDWWESRSTEYASDMAKIVRAPVLHVNADDPEAVVWCAKLAVAFRQKFRRDIVIDLIGYRRHGHNEGDEPNFTQPAMYKKIGTHPTVLKQYVARLTAENSISAEECQKEADQFRDAMQAAYDAVHGKKAVQLPAPVIPASLAKSMTYKKASREDAAAPVETGVPAKKLTEIAKKLTTPPAGFTLNPKLVRLLDQRQKMTEGKGAVDWGFGELLGFASVAAEGHHVRLTGQDARRGTFTSRHAVWTDFETNTRYESMSSLAKDQGKVDVINSPLSEAGCLGFEFGYSVADPDALVAWEAQFGDFCNGAQIIIDQFLSASEAKWKQTSSLVMLLPHGHEGQGPEHSSARPERFLQLCGNLNLQVIIPTTPSQHFHALRRQVHREFRKPLVVMTPKSLLRDPLCVSPMEEFEKGRFHEVLDDAGIKKKTHVERIVACSGKIYYDLIKARGESPQLADVPIIRLEQLYPFPYDDMKALLADYPKLSEIVWAQEEPQNMGGWNFVRGRMLEVVKPSQRLTYVGRKNSGTPAEGSIKAHEIEQKRIVQDALARASGGALKAASATGKGGD